jgi:hypothetical protein
MALSPPFLVEAAGVARVALRSRRRLPRSGDLLAVALTTLRTSRLSLLLRQRQLPNSGEHAAQNVGALLEGNGSSDPTPPTQQAQRDVPCAWSRSPPTAPMRRPLRTSTGRLGERRRGARFARIERERPSRPTGRSPPPAVQLRRRGTISGRSRVVGVEQGVPAALRDAGGRSRRSRAPSRRTASRSSTQPPARPRRSSPP